MSHRTNVYEMQALCPSCNIRKGAKLEQINLEPLREGQRAAVATIVHRVRAEETHTAIVLPTRYGKTDVMRVAGAMLMPVFVSRVLILVPNTYLRAQIVDEPRWESARIRYGLPNAIVDEAIRAPTPPFPRRGVQFVSMTMQMAQGHTRRLVEWVEHEKYRNDVPPLVFVDEAHTGSTENQWGNCVEELARAGAFIVLMTATPFRTDEERIPGFEIDEVEVSNVDRRRRDRHDLDLWELFKGQKYSYQLRAHHITTFQEAWAVSNPPVLCNISRRPFDIEVDVQDALTGEVLDEDVLSKLPDHQARTILLHELRKPKIVEQGCEILVNRLDMRQRREPETAAIVFVGNDQQEDAGDNQHAQAVKRAIKKLQPSLNVEIATTSTRNPDKVIERFVTETDIDVLVVKQMAGIGVDCERLKVCLDLSNVRTLNAFIQRITRVATVWDRRDTSGNEWDIISTADYITPDDAIGRRLYNYFIRDQGGEATREDLEYVGTVRQGEGNGSGDNDQLELPNELNARGLILPEKIQDTKQQVADGTTIPPADVLFGAFPVLAHTHTYPDIAKELPRLRESLRAAYGEQSSPSETSPSAGATSAPVAVAGVRHLGKENKDLRNQIQQRIRDLATLNVGPYKRGGDNSRWVEEQRQLSWYYYRTSVAMPPKVKVEDYDQDILTTILKNVEKDLNRRRQR